VERAEAVAMYRQGEDACVEVLLKFAAAVEAVERLEQRVAELETRLRQNSRNSSKPPSSDGLAKPKPRRSRRRGSGRKPGGQPGSEGHHLAQVEQPDLVVVHEPKRCEGCGESLAGAQLVGAERRQVFDLPPEVRLEVCEHRSLRRRCGCGKTSGGAFPAQVRAPAQYGPRLRAYVLYLAVYQHLPYGRIARLLADCYGASLSTGTLQGIVAQGAAGLEGFLEEVRATLAGSAVVHLDETGARAAGKLHWVHEASTEALTLYGLHERRGRQGIDALGVLPGFTGVAVHDGWAPYRAYNDCEHALCNGHHLRELTGVGDEQDQAWAAAMSELLLELKGGVEGAKDAGATALEPGTLAGYRARYRQIIAAGYARNPEPAPTGKRGRPRQGPIRSLLLRLDQHQDDVLRFACDLNVPFDNNLAERDIRMIKLQQKISGCWRTREGADAFLALRSYISTARKQGEGALAVLRDAVKGEPWLPAAGET
jgi:transposase